MRNTQYTNLASIAAVTTVENKICNDSSLVKKADFHDHDKYITAPEFNKQTEENFGERLT